MTFRVGAGDIPSTLELSTTLDTGGELNMFCINYHH